MGFARIFKWRSFFASANYWSSSQDSSSNAYNLNFNNGNVNSNSKSSAYNVRCVREIDFKFCGGKLQNMGDSRKLPIYLKFFKLIIFLYKIIRSFPKEYKYSLGKEILDLSWECLDKTAEANAFYGKEKNLKILKLSLCFDKLKIRLRLAEEINLISEKQFVHLQGYYLKGLGGMIGGWLKWSNERNI